MPASAEPGPEPHRRVDVCVVGSSNLDLVVTTRRHPAPGETVVGSSYAEYAGGKGLNQAIAAARAGARCAFLTALGDDSAGDMVSGLLASEGIDAGGVQRISGVPTGRALITVDYAGENCIVVVPGANAEIRPATLPAAAVVLAQLEVPVDVVVETFRHASKTSALTILNPAPAAELPDELLACSRIVIPNEHEYAQLGGAARLFGLGVELVITTLGGNGVNVESPAGLTRVAPFIVAPVDTTAAGDAFCGAFAAAAAGGAKPLEAARFAAAAGALATTRPGAVPSLPRLDEIAALLGA